MRYFSFVVVVLLVNEFLDLYYEYDENMFYARRDYTHTQSLQESSSLKEADYKRRRRRSICTGMCTE